MNTDRRNFFKKALTAVAFVPLMGEAFAKACVAGAAPAGKKIADIADKAAKRLDYILVATESKNKKYTAGSFCGNCKFYKTSKEESGHAPCSMMANKYVASCGWCKSYRLDKKKA
ncbi:high-potential iron-sulfur protein [Halobacteriovorax sp. HLS]|uniref:high-potential iron-sulfur protein n=1 Tax=Halobacteriovorax sp. HLS TaxID=2234000 RepID=UPI000FD89E5E|nr:high-potential iron-sulfur protein [Halobacteriovorax sp. HLS]